MNKKIIDFAKALEEAGLSSKGAHKNEQFLSTVKAIVSMSKEEFADYIRTNPNDKVKLIYNEYQDWIQTYEG